MSVKSAEPEGVPWLGSWLKTRREVLGMTQEELAQMTGISVKLISAYENNRVQPRHGNRELLLKALDGALPNVGMPPEPSAVIPEGAEADADRERRPSLFPELTRLVGPQDTRVIVAWMDADGLPVAIAEAHDKRLLVLRARRVSAEDVRPLRALFEDLLERLEASASG